MTKAHKEHKGATSRFITDSLDNVKQFIDSACEELSKSDIVGTSRRMADVLIDSTSETVVKVAGAMSRREGLQAIKQLAVGTLASTRDVVKVANEESHRAKLVDTGAKLTIEALEFLRREVEILMAGAEEMGEAVEETVETVSDNLNKMMPGYKSEEAGTKRPGVITRVEIEADKVMHRSEA